MQPGELILIDADGLHSEQAIEPTPAGAFCIFEFFYLARPDTRLAGWRCTAPGCEWASAWPRRRRSTPTSSFRFRLRDAAAIGFARASGIPYSEGVTKNRYVGRTFIQPEQGMREQGIKMKYNPLDAVAGKRLVLVDDSPSVATRCGSSSRRCSRPERPRCTSASRRRP